MVEATYPAIKAIQPDSKVLVGGTAAIGEKNPRSENSGMPTLRFLRELACVDAKFRPIASGRCSGFRRLPGDGFSHHPYSLRREPDFADRGNPDRAPIGALDRLTATLDRLVRMGRIDRKVADLYLTEFGYETQPDPKAPFNLAQQARFINWAEYLAWKNPRVRSWPQFLLRDVPDLREYQTGLLFADGTPKLAARSFEFALHVDCVTARPSRRRRRGSSRKRGRRARPAAPPRGLGPPALGRGLSPDHAVRETARRVGPGRHRGERARQAQGARVHARVPDRRRRRVRPPGAGAARGALPGRVCGAGRDGSAQPGGAGDRVPAKLPGSDLRLANGAEANQ